MKRRLAAPIMTAAALTAMGGLAYAQTFECGSRLISLGDPLSKVSALCGDPTQVDRTSIVRSSAVWNGATNQSDYVSIEIPVEIWLYNLGSDKLMRRLRFEAGKVVKIETLDYGYE